MVDYSQLLHSIWPGIGCFQVCCPCFWFSSHFHAHVTSFFSFHLCFVHKNRCFGELHGFEKNHRQPSPMDLVSWGRNVRPRKRRRKKPATPARRSQRSILQSAGVQHEIFWAKSSKIQKPTSTCLMSMDLLSRPAAKRLQNQRMRRMHLTRTPVLRLSSAQKHGPNGNLMLFGIVRKDRIFLFLGASKLNFHSFFISWSGEWRDTQGSTDCRFGCRSWSAGGAKRRG